MFSLSLCLRSTPVAVTTKKTKKPSASSFSLFSSIPTFNVTTPSNYYSPSAFSSVERITTMLPSTNNSSNSVNNTSKSTTTKSSLLPSSSVSVMYSRSALSSVLNQISDRIESYPTVEELAERSSFVIHKSNVNKIQEVEAENEEVVFDLVSK